MKYNGELHNQSENYLSFFFLDFEVNYRIKQGFLNISAVFRGSKG